VSFHEIERGSCALKAWEDYSLFKESLQTLPPKSANLNSYSSLLISGWLTKQF